MQNIGRAAIALLALVARAPGFVPDVPIAFASATGAAAATSANKQVAPLAPVAPVALVAPDRFGMTMRVDYFHSGGMGREGVTFDRVSNDGPWPGSRRELIDASGSGKYFYEVTDRATKRVLYSRGFASIYGEWETTPEARARRRTFHESLRFPWPTAPVRIVLKKRDAQNRFRDLWVTEIDPRRVGRQSPQKAGGRVVPLFENGPPSEKVDVLLMSDGYSRDQLAEFRDASARLVDALFDLEPFRSRRSDFNVRMLELPGRPASVEFNVFGIERYALAYDNRPMRDLAASAPYDLLVLVVNKSAYGGGGIFNQQSTVAAGHASSEYVFIHELAHNLAGLADEYVGTVTYETGLRPHVEPWEPNLTALLDPGALKWRDMVEPGTPIPTPLTHSGKVGAFEGGGYEARGLYRPEAECIMGSRARIPFCRVCQRAISQAIDRHVR